MATFRCIWSNNLLEVHYDFDINEMRRHPDYEEVTEEKETKQDNKPKVTKNSKEA
jgi:hypothetical protein